MPSETAEHPELSNLQHQIDELVARIAANRADIDALTSRVDAAQRHAEELEAARSIDREIIAELHADGVVSREHAAQLEQALMSSRTIDAAVGVLMHSRKIGKDEALRVLREASSHSNTSIRRLAEIIVSGPVGVADSRS